MILRPRVAESHTFASARNGSPSAATSTAYFPLSGSIENKDANLVGEQEDE